MNQTTQCMLDACVLAVIVAGLLLIVQAITIKQLCVLAGFLGVWSASCLLRGLIVGFVSPLLWWLAKSFILALVVLILVLVSFLVTDIGVGRGKKEGDRKNETE